MFFSYVCFISLKSYMLPFLYYWIFVFLEGSLVFVYIIWKLILCLLCATNNFFHFVAYHLGFFILFIGFHNGSVGKESVYNTRDTGNRGSIPGSGRSPGEENGNPLQYSCLENPMDREAWWAIIQRVTKRWT